MEQAESTRDGGTHMLFERLETPAYDSYDFGMIAVDVVLGDGTRCVLDFSESLYLGRLLLLVPPVALSFGTGMAMRELKKIVALMHGGDCMGAGGDAMEECENASKGSMKASSHVIADVAVFGENVPAAAPTTPITSATSTTTNSNNNNNNINNNSRTSAAAFASEVTVDKELNCDRVTLLFNYVHQLSNNRRLFMDVLELAARLEMEETFPLLCEEFGRIFDKEVRSKFGTSPAVTLGLVASGHLDINSFRKTVIRAFALDDTSPPSLSQDKKKQQERWTSSQGKEEANWQKQLSEDHYFFPAGQLATDLTQSVDPGALEGYAEATFGKEFTPSFQPHPFHNPTWESDELAKKCPMCGDAFSTWPMLALKTVSPSHCRCCGRRICSRCTVWRLDKSIAKLSRPGGPEEGRLRRACKECFDKAERVNQHAFLCEIFVLGGLMLTDIAFLRSINPQWRGASELCLSDYRSSLYRTTSWKTVVTRQTTRILASSVDILVGHPEPLLFLFISMDWNNQKLVEAAHRTLEKTIKGAVSQMNSKYPSASFWKPLISHWHMLCTRACGLMLPSFFAIKMLECLHRAPDAHPTVELMRTMVTEELLLKGLHSLDPRVSESITVLLLDVFELRTCQTHVTKVLLELSAHNRRLALMICQETFIRCRYDELSYRVLREYVVGVDKKERPETHQHFLNTLRFLDVMRSTWKDNAKQSDIAGTREFLYKTLCRGEVISHPSEAHDAPLKKRDICPMLFPFDTNIVLTEIDFGGVVVMNSKQRPILIPLIDESGKSWCILYKSENLEKDKVMCVASRFLQWVLHKQLRHVVLPTYHVMPLSSSSGIIEIVRDGQTVQRVIEQYTERRLLQYLLSMEERYAKGREQRKTHQYHQQQQAVKTPTQKTKGKGHHHNNHYMNVRENFICSAKFFILMNYVFAIGDRHRDNVMVHPTGAIFHIDFGMLLTTRTLAERVTPSYVRFDLDLEECVLEFMWKEAEKKRQRMLSSTHSPQETFARSHSYSSSLPKSLLDTSMRTQSEFLSTFLMETSDWFLDIRPYAGILYQLLSHVVFRQGFDDVDSVERLAALMHAIFMRDASEETCKTLFCDRVRQSRGQMWLKDLAHDTQKRTWIIFSEGLKWVREKTGLEILDYLS